MNVIEMPEQIDGDQRSIGELCAVAHYEQACLNRQKKKKCNGDCKSCPYGEAHRLKGALDPYQRVWVDYQVERQEVASKATIDDVMDCIGDIVALLILAALIGVFVWFMWWIFTR